MFIILFYSITRSAIINTNNFNKMTAAVKFIRWHRRDRKVSSLYDLHDVNVCQTCGGAIGIDSLGSAWMNLLLSQRRMQSFPHDDATAGTLVQRCWRQTSPASTLPQMTNVVVGHTGIVVVASKCFSACGTVHKVFKRGGGLRVGTSLCTAQAHNFCCGSRMLVRHKPRQLFNKSVSLKGNRSWPLSMSNSSHRDFFSLPLHKKSPLFFSFFPSQKNRRYSKNKMHRLSLPDLKIRVATPLHILFPPMPIDTNTF